MTETRRTKVKRTQRWNMAHRCDARPPSDMRKTRSSCSYSREVALGHKPVFLKCSSKDPNYKRMRANLGERHRGRRPQIAAPC